VGSVFGPIRFLLPVCRFCSFLYTLNIYAHFSSHFSKQLLTTGVLYLVTNFIEVCHIVGSALGPVRFLLPFCRFCWFLCTFNIHLYMHIFRHIFLSNYQRQESDIWSPTSYRYAILWEAFLDPSGSYFLFADFVDLYTHWTYMLIFVAFSSATIDDRNLIFGHKLHICTPYCGKRFWTHQIPASCLPILLFLLCTFNIHLYMDIFRNIFQSNYWRQESDIWSQTSYRYAILWEAFLDPSDSYFLFADFVDL
jgi:hypothetical protein